MTVLFAAGYDIDQLSAIKKTVFQSFHRLSPAAIWPEKNAPGRTGSNSNRGTFVLSILNQMASDTVCP